MIKSLLLFTFSYEVFEYLLSLPDYPIESVNFAQETALMISLTHYVGNNNNSMKQIDEHFAYELIKKGACIDQITGRGYTFLHQALERRYVRVAKLLIEKGVDVNVSCKDNYTPLQVANNLGEHDYCEIVSMLLIYGADPSVQDDLGYNLFEASAFAKRPNAVQETLFYYTYDEFSPLKIHLETLLQLAATNSSLLEEIKGSFEIIINPENIPLCLHVLLSVDSTRLKTIITEFETSLKIFLIMVREEKYDFSWYMFSLDELNVFLESNLKDHMTDLINTSNSTTFVKSLIFCALEIDIDISEYTCYMLSYGLEICETDLHVIYHKFGYCELFKILLHMDFKRKFFLFFLYNVMPTFLINVSVDLQSYFPYWHALHKDKFALRELKSYFCHPILDSVYEERTKLHQVPLLIELARNAFRRHFNDKFQIKTPRKFYTLLNHLPISTVYKKIITYETKLYNV